MKTRKGFDFKFYQKISVVVFVFLLLALNACQPKQTASDKANQKIPQKYEVAKQFINAYAAYSADRSSELGILDWVNAQENVSEAFKTALKNIFIEAELNNPELGLEFDPIFDAQDFTSDFIITDYDGDYVNLSSEKFPNFKVIMKVAIQNERWLVDGAGIVNIPEAKRLKRF